MPVDFQVFIFPNLMAIFLIVMGFLGDEKWSIFPFAGGIMDGWFITTLTDGNISTAYAYTSSFQFNNISDAQLIYIPVILTFLCFTAAIWKVIDASPKGKMIGSLTFIIAMTVIVAYSMTGMVTNLDTTVLPNVPSLALTFIQQDIPFIGTAALIFMLVGAGWSSLKRL